MMQLVKEAQFMYTAELETVTSLCFRALDGSNYDARCAIGKLLGELLYSAQSVKTPVGKCNYIPFSELICIL